MKIWLGVEFTLLFIIAPLIMALALPANWMFPMLWIWTGLGILLLILTRKFSWRKLWTPLSQRDAFFALLFFLVSLGVTLLITRIVMPERMLILPREQFQIWLMIMLLYPILSALPQELIFRALFYERYDAILPKQGGIIFNAAIFSFAHLLYWNATVFALSFIGGLLFARAYRQGHFPMAVLLHSLGGCAIFTSGLGWLFYSGAVGG